MYLKLRNLIELAQQENQHSKMLLIFRPKKSLPLSGLSLRTINKAFQSQHYDKLKYLKGLIIEMWLNFKKL